MTKKKRNTKVFCSKCDTESKNTKKEFITVVAIVTSDSGPNERPHKTEKLTTSLPKTAQERIEALRNAGVNVDNMFSMKGANGGECVASNINGQLTILGDNDPIFNQIIQQGTVPNRRLFRRWVMAQMFHMLSHAPCRSSEPYGVTYMIHHTGYDYQWKMVVNELYAQMKMESRDAVSFSERNRWFNKDTAVAMAEGYVKQLNKFMDATKEKKCKGVPYKHIANRNIFTSDLQHKLYRPLTAAITHIKQAKNAAQLYNATKKFSELRIRMPHDTTQSRAWVDAYKGSGAFFTMQNLIRFHNCIVINDRGRRLDKSQSLAFVAKKAEMYKGGEGWRLLAVLKKMLDDNNIDIREKQAEWQKR